LGSKSEIRQFHFSQMHLDAARYATDDFNLFHDPYRWRQINGNYFDGPIALGFQLNQFVEAALDQSRAEGLDREQIREHHLGFSNYQFNFVGAVKVDVPIQLTVRPTRFHADSLSLSNRFMMTCEDKLVLQGTKRETQVPLLLPDPKVPSIARLKSFRDRSFIDEIGTFIKRKYMNTSNAKTFLLGAGVPQLKYFDELTNKVKFPEIFPCAYLSCALLERYLKMGHDFERSPMVYTSHQISVDRILSGSLKSNSEVSILLSPPRSLLRGRGLGALPISQLIFDGLGVLTDGKILFRAQIGLTTLENLNQPAMGQNS
jgi:hypothetical protein